VATALRSRASSKRTGISRIFFTTQIPQECFFPVFPGLRQIGCWISFVYSICRFQFWSLGPRARIYGGFFPFWVFGIVAKCQSTAKNMPKQQKNATCPNVPDLNILGLFAQIGKIRKTCFFGCFCAFPQKHSANSRRRVPRTYIRSGGRAPIGQVPTMRGENGGVYRTPNKLPSPIRRAPLIGAPPDTGPIFSPHALGPTRGRARGSEAPKRQQAMACGRFFALLPRARPRLIAGGAWRASLPRAPAGYLFAVAPSAWCVCSSSVRTSCPSCGMLCMDCLSYLSSQKERRGG